MKEVNEQYGGVLPPDAVFRPDEEPAAPPLIEKPKGRSGRGERFAALNAFADLTLSSLTGAEVKVWLVLFRDLKRATGTARTGQADIARRAGLSRRGVQVALDKLQAKGLVRVVRRGRLDAGPSAYSLHPTGTV
jgi:hypothetical protein